MRTTPALILLGISLAAAASAQVEFSAKLTHSELLLCEPVPVVVTLQNKMPTALVAGDTQGYSLVFEVTGRDGLLVRQRPEEALPELPEIPAGGTVIITNDLQALFPLSSHSMLGVRARLTLGNRSYVTEKMFFDILPGSEIARLQARASDGELRTFSLRVLNREKRDRLFLRVGNEGETLCYGVSDLGRFVRLGKPAIELDAQGRVHVLHLTGPNQFSYSVHASDAGVLSRKTFEGDVSMVRLVPDGEGGFRVTGMGQLSPRRDPMVEPLPIRRGL
ncbi:MAG TPA: hypothetical protein PKE12_09590 [Kiritimatiellia bacterium]|nr:hypothetical protein [Kiritimatiellia bacterium]